MKNIVLIGASGFVGSAIRKEALRRGLHVKAVVRNIEGLQPDENIEYIQVNIMETTKLAEVLKGADAVISAYNPGWSDPNIYHDTLKGYHSILDAVKQSGVKRFQMVGGAGTLYVSPGVTLLDSGDVPEKIRPGVESLGLVLTDILAKEKDIDWVFFSPAANLVDGQRTGSYRLGHDDMITGKDGESEISVQDYAKAMIDELENPQYHKQRFTIGY